MKEIGGMKFYTLEEVTDEMIGEIGTPKRDEFERRISDEMAAYKVGQAVRESRIQKNITQEQLGNMAGINRSVVSRVENGQSTSFSTLSRIFRAMGMKASLEVSGLGSIML